MVTQQQGSRINKFVAIVVVVVVVVVVNELHSVNISTEANNEAGGDCYNDFIQINDPPFLAAKIPTTNEGILKEEQNRNVI